ncbi:GNAT family N-acetyltransferase [bacterium]|nr:GNAT family N-acetyltransferase [bacterium]
MNDSQGSIQIRTMLLGDLPACQQLKQQVGWNQTLDDWRRFVELNPEGCFVATHLGDIAGTVCTVAYQKCGWVAMVIVDPQHRRKGIGKMLLLKGIEHLEQRQLIVKLDATPEGKKLYDTLGFKDEYTGGRYECDALSGVWAPSTCCEKLSLGHLDELSRIDRGIFGDDRSEVLASYIMNYPDNAFCVIVEDKIIGYIMAREGEHAFHIGPWVALRRDAAQVLFQHCLNARKPERVFVDVVSPNPHAATMLQEWGFVQQRPFIRMVRGENLCAGKPEFVYGMSGPELG